MVKKQDNNVKKLKFMVFESMEDFETKVKAQLHDKNKKMDYKKLWFSFKERMKNA